MNEPTYVARANDVAARQIGDEFMIMSGKDSSLFSLNETAAMIWKAADGATTLEEIVEKHLCPEFEVDRETALADARQLVDELAEHGILRLSAAPAA
jgi:hypothetical protein